MLKGWLDRVWVPHATFSMPQDNKPIGRVLTNIRLIVAVTTLGCPRWLWWLTGMPGRRTLFSGIGAVCNRRRKTLWLAHYGMDSSTPASRRAFVERVERRLASL
jgi:NAD(P)H dehydrogenase (quinone)